MHCPHGFSLQVLTKRALRCLTASWLSLKHLKEKQLEWKRSWSVRDMRVVAVCPWCEPSDWANTGLLSLSEQLMSEIVCSVNDGYREMRKGVDAALSTYSTRHYNAKWHAHINLFSVHWLKMDSSWNYTDCLCAGLHNIIFYPHYWVLLH